MPAAWRKTSPPEPDPAPEVPSERLKTTARVTAAKSAAAVTAPRGADHHRRDPKGLRDLKDLKDLKDSPLCVPVPVPYRPQADSVGPPGRRAAGTLLSVAG
jgi:hypothetical protein